MNRISFVEGFFMIIICAFGDLAEFVITWIFLDGAGAGEVFKWCIDLFDFAVIGLWLKIKGVKGTWFYVSSLLEAIPVVNFLPLRTIGMAITIWLVNKAADREEQSIIETSLQEAATQQFNNRVSGRPVTNTSASAGKNTKPLLNKPVSAIAKVK